jgi:hypothetical protein
LKTLFTVQDTTNALIGYTFWRKKVAHEFCGTCGVSLFERFESPTLAINARTMNDLALTELQLQKADGKGILPLYEVQ